MVQKNKKYPACGSSVEENAFLIPEVRGTEEQEIEATIHMDSAKVDNRRHRVSISASNIQMVGSEFGVNNMKAWIHPAINSSG